MKRIFGFCVTALLLAGCVSSASRMTGDLAVPDEFLALEQSGATAVDATCKEVGAPENGLVKAVFAPLTDSSKLMTYTLEAKALAIMDKPGNPFLQPQAAYRIFSSKEGTKIGSLEQYNQYLTHQIGSGGKVDVKVLP